MKVIEQIHLVESHISKLVRERDSYSGPLGNDLMVYQLDEEIKQWQATRDTLSWALRKLPKIDDDTDVEHPHNPNAVDKTILNGNV